MFSDALAALRCPLCQGTLQVREDPRRALACGSGHLFDAAKQGYFNLLTGKGTVFEADTADMVAARHRFLDAGHYSGLAATVAKEAAGALQGPGALVLDAGTGTGHYLHAVVNQSGAAAIGLDISKFALRRAARLNPQALNLVWDIWRPLPVADHSVDVVMVVFAPRNPAEFARVIRPGGKLIVVTPRPGHLAEAAAATGMLGIEEGKEERLAGTMKDYFSPAAAYGLDIPLELTGPQVQDLAYMGPAGHHHRRHAEQGVPAGVLATTAKFRISVFTAS